MDDKFQLEEEELEVAKSPDSCHAELREIQREKEEELEVAMLLSDNCHTEMSDCDIIKHFICQHPHNFD